MTVMVLQPCPTSVQVRDMQSPSVNFDLLCPGSKPMQKPKEASVHLPFVKVMKIDDNEVVMKSEVSILVT